MRKAGHGFMTCRLRKFSRWFKWQKKQHFLFIWHTEEKFLVLILTSDGALGSNRGRGQPPTCRATVHGQTHGRGCLRVKRKGLLTSGLKVRASPYPQTSSRWLRPPVTPFSFLCNRDVHSPEMQSRRHPQYRRRTGMFERDHSSGNFSLATWDTLNVVMRSLLRGLQEGDVSNLQSEAQIQSQIQQSHSNLQLTACDQDTG